MRKFLILALLVLLMVVPMLPASAQMGDAEELTTLLTDATARLESTSGVYAEGTANDSLTQNINFQGQEINIVSITEETAEVYGTSVDGQINLRVVSEISTSNFDNEGMSTIDFLGEVLLVDGAVYIVADEFAGTEDTPAFGAIAFVDGDEEPVNFGVLTPDQMLEESPYEFESAIDALEFASSIVRFDNGDGTFTYTVVLTAADTGDFLLAQAAQDEADGEEVDPVSIALAEATQASSGSSATYIFDFADDGTLLNYEATLVLAIEEFDLSATAPDELPPGVTAEVLGVNTFSVSFLEYDIEVEPAVAPELDE